MPLKTCFPFGVTGPDWSNWSECSPTHNCLDTVSPGQTCPTRTRTGIVRISGELTEIIQEISEGCNCNPCTFRLTDWVDAGCTRDAGINGGDGDCPCHWTQYRYCQQLSNGIFRIKIPSENPFFTLTQ